MTTPAITPEERKELYASPSVQARMDALEAALTDCHEFFGQMYAHGIRLPHAGEQQLERVASCVAKLMESNEKL